MAKVYLLLLCVVAFGPLRAQEQNQPVRVQLPFTSETQVEIFALPDSSLLLYSKTSEGWGSKAAFRLDKFNTELETVWSMSLDIPSECEYLKHFTEAPYVYFAFSGKKGAEYKFLRLNIYTGHATLTEKVFENIGSIYEYGVIAEKHFMIAQSTKDGNPLLFHFDAYSKEPQVLPTIYDDRSSFSDFLIDTENRQVDVVLTESNRRISRLQVKSFDLYGKLISNHFILQRGNTSLLNAEVSPGDSTTKLLFGTYGTRDVRYAQGFFVADVTSGLVNADFYSMLELQNFYRFMKPRREKRVRSREETRLDAGKEPLNRYRLLLHDLMPTPKGYIFAAEIYYPQSRSGNSLGPQILSASPRYEEGYRRSHLVVLVFDKSGQLLWDNIVSLDGIVTPTLTHAVEIAYTPDNRVIVAYPEDSKIVYRILKNEMYEDKHTEVELLSSKEDKKMKATYGAGVIRWYGSHFAAFGFTENSGRGLITEEVFYLNKITL